MNTTVNNNNIESKNRVNNTLPAEVHIDVEPTFFDEQSGKAEREPASEITEQREQNDACISSAESRRDKTNGQITASSEQGINVGTEVWTTIELDEEYGKRGKVVRRFFADHGVWCLDIEFDDGTTACYAEEYVTTEKPWAVVGTKCRHRYLNRDVVLTITAVGQYYGIKAESEDGKVKRCGLVRYFEPEAGRRGA